MWKKEGEWLTVAILFQAGSALSGHVQARAVGNNSVDIRSD